MVNDLKVEELLIQANPVLDPEELRLTAAEVDARCASILERRGVMQTQTPVKAPVAVPGPPRWRKPAFAFVIGLFVVLVAAGGVALLVGGGDSDVVEETTVTTPTTTPTTTTPPTTTPTTVPEANLDGVITAPAYAEVRQFWGLVEYYQHDPALGDPGWQAAVAIEYGGELRYKVEVVGESGDHLFLAGAGTVFFGDGTENWVDESDDLGPRSINDFEPFRHLFFEGGRWGVGWDEVCGSTPAEIGLETIAGRTATHVMCSTAMEDYELWIDEELGIVLRMAGPLALGDPAPHLDRDGYFQFIELRAHPVPTPDEPADPWVDYDFSIIGGYIAPLWSGPLVGGGEFDLADYRGPDGSHVVVFDWYPGPGCGQTESCADGLELMERLYAEYQGSAVAFVSVGEDLPDRVEQVVERLGLEVPTVYCFDNDLMPEQGHNQACSTPIDENTVFVDPAEASPWYLWRNWPPTTWVLDESGVIVAIYDGPAAEYEADLEALLAEIAETTQ